MTGVGIGLACTRSLVEIAIGAYRTSLCGAMVCSYCCYSTHKFRHHNNCSARYMINYDGLIHSLPLLPRLDGLSEQSWASNATGLLVVEDTVGVHTTWLLFKSLYQGGYCKNGADAFGIICKQISARYITL